jgi:hypothetical protein
MFGHHLPELGHRFGDLGGGALGHDESTRGKSVQAAAIITEVKLVQLNKAYLSPT